jgi:Zn-dependent alcohol dehydrogenase
VVNSREVDPVEAIKELTGGGVDMAFDSFGSAQTVNSSVMALRKAGTAVMIGLGPVGDTAPIDMVDFLRNQKSLLSSYYGAASPHETFDKLIDFYLKGLLDVESLITRTYPLEEINEGFDALGRGEDGRGIIAF